MRNNNDFYNLRNSIRPTQREVEPIESDYSSQNSIRNIGELEEEVEVEITTRYQPSNITIPKSINKPKEEKQGKSGCCCS
jgi:hypothetical protein